MFSYPKDIKSLLEQAWKRKGIILPEISKLLPEDDILEELVEVAYHASFKTEEQRKVAFHVAFFSKADFEKNSKVRKVEFTNPISYSVNGLYRLAPATDHSKVLIGVTTNNERDSGSEETKLKIWGLIDIGLSYWKTFKMEDHIDAASFSCLTIFSDTPGSLTISLQNEVLVILRHGELYIPPLYSFRYGPLSDFFLDAQHQIYQDFLSNAQYKENEELYLFSDPKIEYIKNLERILSHIRDMLHGGTLIILSKNMLIDDIVKQDKLSIKYKCEYDIIWDLIVRKASLECRRSKIFQSMLDKKAIVSREVYFESRTVDMDLLKTESDLYDSVLFFSSLSSVDGAIVLNDRLCLLGFGAELRVYGDIKKKIHFSEDAAGNNFYERSYESFGTRHRSAFRFCSEYPESVAFVISQDGDLKAIKNVDNDLIVWTDPNVGVVK